MMMYEEIKEILIMIHSLDLGETPGIANHTRNGCRKGCRALGLLHQE
jgi:hypothetical protein